MDLEVSAAPLSARRFCGLGFQADCYIYDDVNRQMGVGEDDYELVERRLKALRPSVVRVFVPITEFNPTCDGATYAWDTPEFQRQLRLLRVVREAGATVNVCMSPATNTQMREEGMEATAVDLVEHLIRDEGLDNIGWLSLFNEPDTLYRHDSPLYERLYADRDTAASPHWDRYVAKHRATRAMLEQRGLAPTVRLIVADTVWGYAMRRERMTMSVRDFADLDVGYSYHSYVVDSPGFYDSIADFRPPDGLGGEAAAHRQLLGPDRELMCWEFNNAGIGFGSAFPGTGPHGEDLLGTFGSAVSVSRKVLGALAGGVDGMALWCMGDMFYASGLRQGVMYFGLWRYKWRGWRPRPVYYYYAALIGALRGGATLHSVDGAGEGVVALAARDDEGWAIVLLNTGAEATTASLRLPATGPARRLRVCPERIPAEGDLPLGDWEDLPREAGRVALELAGAELTVIRVAAE